MNKQSIFNILNIANETDKKAVITCDGIMYVGKPLLKTDNDEFLITIRKGIEKGIPEINSIDEAQILFLKDVSVINSTSDINLDIVGLSLSSVSAISFGN